MCPSCSATRWVLRRSTMMFWNTVLGVTGEGLSQPVLQNECSKASPFGLTISPPFQEEGNQSRRRSTKKLLIKTRRGGDYAPPFRCVKPVHLLKRSPRFQEPRVCRRQIELFSNAVEPSAHPFRHEPPRPTRLHEGSDWAETPMDDVPFSLPLHSLHVS